MCEMNAAIIGSGQAGQAHLEAVRRLGYVKVLGMVASTPERTLECCRKNVLDAPFTAWQDAVRHPAVDVVHLCSPNHLHYAIIKTALQAGKHVLSEKPLTVSLPEALELLRLAEREKLVHGVMFNYRMYALVEEARQLIAAGKIGGITAIRGHYLQDWLMTANAGGWRLDPLQNGPHGVVADIGSHYFDLIEYVTGLRVSHISACLGYLKGKERYPARADILYRLNTGATGVCVLSQASPGHNNDLELAVEGTEASVGWRQECPEELIIGHPRGTRLVQVKDAKVLSGLGALAASYPPGHIEGWPDGVKNLMRQFYAAVRARKYGMELQTTIGRYPDFSDGVRSSRIIHAISESSEKDGWAEVAPG